MKINSMTFINRFSNLNTTQNINFGSANDISLQYVYDNRLELLPPRMQIEVQNTLLKYQKGLIKKLPTLMKLHIDTYKDLNSCKSLESAKKLYPEFQDLVDAHTIIKKQSINTKIIDKAVGLENFALYMLKERWANLKTMDEIAKDLNVKSRNSLGWFLEKINFPELSGNYQVLLKSSTTKFNNLASKKTKEYNKKNPDKMLIHNRMLAQRPEIIQMNKELMQRMWERMPELKEEMSRFKHDNPQIPKQDFSEAFWSTHPEYKKEMSKIRREIAYERRCEFIKHKKMKTTS